MLHLRIWLFFCEVIACILGLCRSLLHGGLQDTLPTELIRGTYLIIVVKEVVIFLHEFSLTLISTRWLETLQFALFLHVVAW